MVLVIIQNYKIYFLMYRSRENAIFQKKELKIIKPHMHASILILPLNIKTNIGLYIFITCTH